MAEHNSGVAETVAPRPRVGFPRAMGYYYLYPFFRALLQAWSAELVLSSPTTPALLDRMDACPTDEPCLAVKLHFSHADALAGRADIDLLLVPVIKQIAGVTCCPKFIGIADMIRHGLRLPDERLVTPVMAFDDSDTQLITALQPLAERLGIHNRWRIRDGIRRARQALVDCAAVCRQHGLTTPEAYRVIDGAPVPTIQAGTGPATAVIGHAYLLYEVVSQGMIERLRQYGPVVTTEMVAPADGSRQVDAIPDGVKLWPFEASLLGAALHLLRARAVARLILVGSFECGPESMIEAYIEEEAQRQGIPFMLLALDEHSGEAGLQTRIEAFMDMDAAEPDPLPVPAVHAVPGRRIVGMPSMGHMQRVILRVLEGLNVETRPTPVITPAIVELGREQAPEFVCYPFTATLGQMRALLDAGATTLVMVGGKGYCRLGWYAQVQEHLLRNMGYDFEMIVIDAPLPYREKWGAFRDAMQRMTNHAPWPRIIGEVYEGFQRLYAMDRADQLLHRLRAYERVIGTTDRLHARYHARLLAADGVGAIHAAERAFREEISHVETEETHPLRIRVTGEIWVVLESSVTRDVERRLGSREHPRVWIDRELSTTQWFDSHVLLSRQAMRRERQLLEAARPWLAVKVGGHGQQTLGTAALAKAEGMDGLLHIFPFTCMPEIIAQNILVRLGEELDLPILTYIVSEQTGEAGMETRLESFLDLLDERRHGLPGGCEEKLALPGGSMYYNRNNEPFSRN